MAKKKEKSKDDLSIDWFEDHEPYEEDEELVSDEKLEEVDEFFDDEENFRQRVGHFLANQPVDVSLEKMLEAPTSNLEDNLPKKEEESNKPPENSIDYMAKPEEEQMKYQVMESEAHFSRPDMSSTERILDEQKQLYKHISAPGHMIGEDRNEEMMIRPEDTMKKGYLTKKKFKTGPY